MKKVSLVLSGGGIRGVAHIGLIAAMNDHNIGISAISGSSAGALVGALYASGKSVNEMLAFFEDASFFNILNMSIKRSGVFDSNKYREVFEAVLPERFEDLNTDLYVCTTNLEAATAHYFSEGELVKPVLASCAIPILYTPVKFDDVIHTDGGIADNFPIDPLLVNNCDHIWGSYITKPYPMDDDELDSTIKITSRINNIYMYNSSKAKFKATELMFEPNMNHISALDTKMVTQAFNIGYASAKNLIEKYLAKA